MAQLAIDDENCRQLHQGEVVVGGGKRREGHDSPSTLP